MWKILVLYAGVALGLAISIGLTAYNISLSKFYHDHDLDLLRSADLHDSLERIGNGVARETDIDTFFVILFHQAPHHWIDEVVEPIAPYASAIYFWTGPAVRNPIANRQNIPIYGFEHIGRTLAGECTGAGYSNGGNDLGNLEWENQSRLLAICPLKHEDRVIGFMGTMSLNGDPLTIYDRLDVLKRYTIRVEQALYD